MHYQRSAATTVASADHESSADPIREMIHAELSDEYLSALPEEIRSRFREAAYIVLHTGQRVEQTTHTRRSLEMIRRLNRGPIMEGFVTSASDALVHPKTAQGKHRALRDLIRDIGRPPVDGMDKFALNMLERIPPGMFSPPMMWAAKRRVLSDLEQFFVVGQEHDPEEAVRKLEGVRAHTGLEVELNFAAEGAISTDEARANAGRYIKAVKAGVRRMGIKPGSLVPFASPAATDVGGDALALRIGQICKEAEAQGRSGQPIPTLTLDSEHRGLYDMILRGLEQCSMQYPQVPLGVALQAYLPDSWHYMEEILALSKRRVDQGGVPLEFRVVMGANLGGQQQAAAIAGLAGSQLRRPAGAREDGSPTFATMEESQAHWMAIHEHLGEYAKQGYARITLASMNLLRMVYTLIALQEKDVLQTGNVNIAMLYGMPHTEMLAQFARDFGVQGHLYVPYVGKNHTYMAMPYYGRRAADEAVGKGHAIRIAAQHPMGSREWLHEQREPQRQALEIQQQTSYPLSSRFLPQRGTERQVIDCADGKFHPIPAINLGTKEDRAWLHERVAACLKYLDGPPEEILLQPGLHNEGAKLRDLNGPHIGKHAKPLIACVEYAQEEDIAKAYVIVMQDAAAKDWSDPEKLESRMNILKNVISKLHEWDAKLVESLMLDLAKSGTEAVRDTVEGGDFVNLGMLNMIKILERKNLRIQPEGNGVAVVICPKNFMAIPMDAIFLRLLAGYRVILKPSGGMDEESIYSAYQMVKCFWEAGVPKEALVFFPCNDAVAGKLVEHEQTERINFTGGSATASRIRKLNPAAELRAETGGDGGNAMIIGEDADLRTAASMAAQSIVEFSGRKCSRPGLIVLTKGVDRKTFEELLQKALDAMCVDDVTKLHVDATPLMPGERTEPLMELGKQETGWLRKPLHPGDPSIRLADPATFHPEENGEYFGPTAVLLQVDGGTKEAIEFAQRAKGSLTFSVVTDNEEDIQWALKNVKTGNTYVGEVQSVGARADWSFGDGMGTSKQGWASTGDIMDMVASTGFTRVPGKHAPYNQEEVVTNRAGLKTLAEKLDQWSQNGYAQLKNRELAIEMDAMRHALWSYLHEMDTRHSTKQFAPYAIEGQENWVESKTIGTVAVRIAEGASAFEAFSKAFAAVISGNAVMLSMPENVHEQFQAMCKTLGYDIEQNADVRVAVETDKEFAATLQANAEGFAAVSTTQPREQVPPNVHVAAAKHNLYIDCRPVTGDGLVDLGPLFRYQSYCRRTLKNGNDSRKRARTFAKQRQ